MSDLREACRQEVLAEALEELVGGQGLFLQRAGGIALAVIAPTEGDGARVRVDLRNPAFGEGDPWRVTRSVAAVTGSRFSSKTDWSAGHGSANLHR